MGTEKKQTDTRKLYDRKRRDLILTISLLLVALGFTIAGLLSFKKTPTNRNNRDRPLGLRGSEIRKTVYRNDVYTRNFTPSSNLVHEASALVKSVREHCPFMPLPYYAHKYEAVCIPEIDPRENAWKDISSCIVPTIDSYIEVRPLVEDAHYTGLYLETESPKDRSRPLLDDETKTSISPKARAQLQWIQEWTQKHRWSQCRVTAHIGPGSDAGGLQRDFIGAIWTFLTDERLGLVVTLPGHHSVFLNPNLPEPWMTLVMRVWAKHQHILESPVPAPNIDGRCLWMLFKEPSEDKIEEDLVHAYLMFIDPEYKRLMLTLDLVSRPRQGHDGDLFSEVDGRLLLGWLEEQGLENMAKNDIKNILNTTDHMEAFGEMRDSPTKVLEKHYLSSLHLWKGANNELLTLEQAHQTRLFAQKDAEFEQEGYNVKLRNCKVFDLKDYFAIRHPISAVQFEEPQELNLENEKSVLLAGDVFRTTSTWIRDAFVEKFMKNRLEFLSKQGAGIKAMIPQQNWTKLAEAALHLQSHRVTLKDITNKLQFRRSCDMVYFYGRRPLTETKDNKNVPFSSVDVRGLIAEVLGILGEAQQYFDQVKDEKDPKKRNYYIVPRSNSVIKRPVCNVTPLEAFVKLFSGTVSTNPPKLEVNCSENLEHMLSAHTCGNTITLLKGSKEIEKKDDLGNTFSITIEKIDAGSLAAEIMSSACTSSYSST